MIPYEDGERAIIFAKMMEDPQDWRPTEVGSSESGSASCRVTCNGASGVAVSKVNGLRIDPEAVVRSK